MRSLIGAGVKAEGQCSRAGCTEPAKWVPRFSFRPWPGYTGKPAECIAGVPICESCRPRFLEHDWRPLAASAAAPLRAAGFLVDDSCTTVEMLEAGSATPSFEAEILARGHPET